MTDSTSMVRALLVTGVVLFFGARYAVRTAMPPRKGRHRRKPGSPKPAPQRTPVPVAGGATGLLESIPFLEPAPQRTRSRGAVRLMIGIAATATVVALILFLFARQLTAWLDTTGL